MISTAEIAKLAHRLGVGDRVIEKDYVLSWLLVAIAQSTLRDQLVFKGGTALKKCYYPDYRFSEDLDFTLRADLSHDNVTKAFVTLFPRLSRQVNLALTLHSAELSVFESTTLLIDYEGPLRGRMGSRHLKVDLTRGELLLCPPAERPLQASYSDYPAGVTLPTYTLEEIMAEKLCALLGRTEPRDLYDVYWLFENSDIDAGSVPTNLTAKSRHKGYDANRLGEILQSKVNAYTRLWESRLAIQVPDLPRLNEVLRAVQRHLRELALI